MTAVVYKK